MKPSKASASLAVGVCVSLLLAGCSGNATPAEPSDPDLAEVVTALWDQHWQRFPERAPDGWMAP